MVKSEFSDFLGFCEIILYIKIHYELSFIQFTYYLFLVNKTNISKNLKRLKI